MGLDQIEEGVLGVEDAGVVGEEAEHQTDQEYLQLLAGVAILLEGIVQIAEYTHGALVDGVLVAQALGLVAGDETEEVDSLGQVRQFEFPLGTLVQIVIAEAGEIRNHHITRYLPFLEAREVIEGLLEGTVQVLPRAFMLGEQGAWPEHIDAAVLGIPSLGKFLDMLFEYGNPAPGNAEYLEKLVPEGLRFALLGSHAAPIAGEGGGAGTDFVPDEGGHVGIGRGCLSSSCFISYLARTRLAVFSVPAAPSVVGWHRTRP